MFLGIEERHLGAVILAGGLALTSSAAFATTIVSGDGDISVLLGAGDNDISGQDLTLGDNPPSNTTLTINGGTILTTDTLFGANQPGSVTNVIVDGVNTRVNINGSTIHNSHFGIAQQGTGSMTVSGGAVVDATNDPGCGSSCFNSITNGAGATGSLTVTGQDSRLSAIGSFVVAGAGVNTQAGSGFDFGTPGGTSNGSVTVSDGGLLETQAGTLGRVSAQDGNGNEVSNATVTVTGQDSKWVVRNDDAFVSIAGTTNSTGTLNIENGGLVQIDGRSGGAFPGINISGGSSTPGGAGTINVDGKDGGGNASRLEILTTNGAGFMNIGRNGGTANLNVTNGGRVDGGVFASVGRKGATGNVLVDGQDSLLRFEGAGGPDTGGSQNFGAFLNIGRTESGQAGTGTVTVSNGGRLELDGVGVDSSAGDVGFVLARGAGSNGTLNIQGTNSTVMVRDDTRAPFATVGRDGTGNLNVTSGGKLIFDGSLVSGGAPSNVTGLSFGGNSVSGPGGVGNGLVSGQDSEIRITGSNAALHVGFAAGATGGLTVNDKGKLATSGLFVGNAGSTGTLNLNDASVDLSGNAFNSGAFLTIGRNGTGTVNATNGTQINLDGSANGASVAVASSPSNPGGTATLNLTSGSDIAFSGTSAGRMIVGGTAGAVGNVAVNGGSTISGLGASGEILLANNATAVGTMTVSNGSSVDAGGLLGIGHNGTIDTGTAVLTVNDTSSVQADTIRIGAGGVLGGDGTVIGNVVNGGTINAGNSPGRLRIQGGYTDAGGTIVLEIESDGAGGFNTDSIVFDTGLPPNLDGTDIVFAFLGDTDPLAFAGSGAFGLDTFFKVNAPGTDDPGQDDPISALLAPGQTLEDLFMNVSYAARSEGFDIVSFAFDAIGGADIVAVPNAVPEPTTLLIMLTGLAGLGWARRRSRRA